MLSISKNGSLQWLRTLAGPGANATAGWQKDGRSMTGLSQAEIRRKSPSTRTVRCAAAVSEPGPGCNDVRMSFDSERVVAPSSAKSAPPSGWRENSQELPRTAAINSNSMVPPFAAVIFKGDPLSGMRRGVFAGTCADGCARFGNTSAVSPEGSTRRTAT